VQLVPLQDLNIRLFEIETARQHLGDVPVALHFCRLIEEFHDPAVFAVFDRVFRLCDKVGVVFGAHGYRL